MGGQIYFPYRSTDIVALKDAVAGRLPGDAAWAAFARRLVTAWLRHTTTEIRGGHTEGGAWRRKTRTERSFDAGAWDAMAWAAADHPLTPLGATDFAVGATIASLFDEIAGPQAKAAS